MLSKLDIVWMAALALLVTQSCQAAPLPSDNYSDAAPPCEAQPQAQRGRFIQPFVIPWVIGVLNTSQIQVYTSVSLPCRPQLNVS
jgi:hypothetical protein